MVGWIGQNSANRVTSVEHNLLLQKKHTVSLLFTPMLEDASYMINLEFDKAQKRSHDCYDIRSSNIEWSIMTDEKLIQAGNLNNPDVECNETDQAVTVSFFAPNLIPSHKYVLNLSVVDKQQKEVKLKSRVSIEPFGIAVHYAFMDLALQEIVLYVLLIVGFGCFLPDVYGFVFCRRHREPND